MKKVKLKVPKKRKQDFDEDDTSDEEKFEEIKTKELPSNKPESIKDLDSEKEMNILSTKDLNIGIINKNRFDSKKDNDPKVVDTHSIAKDQSNTDEAPTIKDNVNKQEIVVAGVEAVSKTTKPSGEKELLESDKATGLSIEKNKVKKRKRKKILHETKSDQSETRSDLGESMIDIDTDDTDEEMVLVDRKEEDVQTDKQQSIHSLPIPIVVLDSERSNDLRNPNKPVSCSGP